ncbi:hypothetical protein M3175_20645 [Robertmurraya korlensis]|uniref:hypothetical protein n=1 Tax=Robertmurraya korlensis TaxID=519977 RepID=UPI00203C0078|nr:hypothetical protein [Robertmurraya korlensis]MCM3603152.1 hypothetical protein [Robertmurraya korlensis]
MTVDDHAIDSLRTWFNIAYDELKEEWKSGRYEVVSDCPAFYAANAYRDAMNVLIKAYHRNEGDKYLIKPLSERISEELELENFWKDRKGSL